MERIWLKVMRVSKNMKCSDVANAVGISQASYSNIETGKNNPRPQTAQKIAELLGFDWTMFYKKA